MDPYLLERKKWFSQLVLLIENNGINQERAAEVFVHGKFFAIFYYFSPKGHYREKLKTLSGKAFQKEHLFCNFNLRICHVQLLSRGLIFISHIIYLITKLKLKSFIT